MDAQTKARGLGKLAEAYRATFLHPAGQDCLPYARVVLADLRSLCGVDVPRVPKDGQGRIDPYALAFNEGKRFVYLRIQQAIKLPPERLQAMIENALRRESEDE